MQGSGTGGVEEGFRRFAFGWRSHHGGRGGD
jgi:hypothetical protein